VIPPVLIFTSDIKAKTMRTLFEISSEETGTVVLRRRKIAKALRRWLREKGVPCNQRFYVN